MIAAASLGVVSRQVASAREELAVAHSRFVSCPSLANFAKLRRAAVLLLDVGGHDGCGERCENNQQPQGENQ